MFLLLAAISLGLYNVITEPAHMGDATTLGQVMLMVTFIINTGVQLWRERRNRKWQVEDSEQREARLAQHEVKMVNKLDQQTEELKASARTRVQDLGTTLDQLLTERKTQPNERRDT